jgi:hypothetical protein
MTDNAKFKKAVRARTARTGEKYTQARRSLLSLPFEPDPLAAASRSTAPVVNDRSGGGKRAGKSEWADRRRPVVVRSGYKVHGDRTGSEIRRTRVGGWRFNGRGSVRVRFAFPAVDPGTRFGWGAWFNMSEGVEVSLHDFEAKSTLKRLVTPDWGKAGSVWYSTGEPQQFDLVFAGSEPNWHLALYDISAGVVEHQFYEDVLLLESKRAKRLLGNMYDSAPEGLFISPDVHASVSIDVVDGSWERVEDLAEILVKSCNRCGRFLPINVPNERQHLSFTNHCNSKVCIHPAFGKLTDSDAGEVLKLTHGFQLECRFCKKWMVNTPLNATRTASQMKEDAARRRAFEVLLASLYDGSPSLLHRRRFGGRELTESVWRRFGGRCFKCDTELSTQKDMHLDHTRPLALLWPLDESATCLCATDNSAKRDRPPSEFYDADELARLSEITGVPLQELEDPSPNVQAIKLLASRLDWFFDEFLQDPDLQMERDGKRPADLLVKALQKAIDRSDVDLDLISLHRRSR